MFDDTFGFALNRVKFIVVKLKLIQLNFRTWNKKILQGKINGRSDVCFLYEVSSKQFNVKYFSYAQRRNTLVLQKTKFYWLRRGFIVINHFVCSSEELQTRIDLFCWLNQDELTAARGQRSPWVVRVCDGGCCCLFPGVILPSRGCLVEMLQVLLHVFVSQFLY